MEDPRYCPICFDKFTEPVILKCGHTFDKSCIINEEICPICRTEIEVWTTNWQVVHMIEHFPVEESISLDDQKYSPLTDSMYHYRKTLSWTGLKKGQRIGYTLKFTREKKVFYGWVHHIDIKKNQLEIYLSNKNIVTICPEFIDELWYHPGYPDDNAECTICILI
jgi:hypothetical protein